MEAPASGRDRADLTKTPHVMKRHLLTSFALFIGFAGAPLRAQDTAPDGDAALLDALEQIRQENYESALEKLGRIDTTDADELKEPERVAAAWALANYLMLEREKAMESLNGFDEKFPDSGPRTRAIVDRLRELSAAYKDDNILGVRDSMHEARRRLAHTDSGETTQQHQQHAMAVLDKIIEEAQQSSSPGSGSGNQLGPPTGGSPAQQSGIRQGGGNANGRRVHATGGNWGDLPDSERKEIVSDIQAELPKRDREMVEQYFKTLAEEDED